MALTGSSTFDDALSQFRANLGYESDATGASARLFIEAGRFLLTMPVRSRGSQGEVQYDPTAVRMQVDKAAAWLSSTLGENVATAPTTTPRQCSFERFSK